MSKIIQRLPLYDYQEGLSWIWRELEDLISYRQKASLCSTVQFLQCVLHDLANG